MGRASFPPGEAKEGHCEFAWDFIKTRVPTATPQPLRRQLPFQGRFGRTNLLPPLGVVLRAANQDSNDCRWQSYLCFVPRSGKGGAVGDFEL